MNRHLFSGWLLFIVLVPATAAVFGCGVRGERARDGCPADEVCSDATPDGLLFRGAGISGRLPGSDSIAPVAVGGTQRIRVSPVGGASLPAFDALSTSSTIEVAGAMGAEIELIGVAPGSTTLRVVERAGGGLLDRLTISAAVVDRAVTAPNADLLVALAPERRDSVFAPGEHEIAVHLLDAGGRVVVDEGMTIDAGVAANVVRWDAVEVVVPASGLDLSVAAAGSTFVARVVAAGAIDGVELATWIMDEDDAGRPRADAGESVCALGLSGDAWVVPSAITASAFSLDGVALVASEGVGRHCATIPADAAEGLAELTVSIEDATRTFTIAVTADAAAASAPLVAAPASLHSATHALGERAR